MNQKTKALHIIKQCNLFQYRQKAWNLFNSNSSTQHPHCTSTSDIVCFFFCLCVVGLKLYLLPEEWFRASCYKGEFEVKVLAHQYQFKYFQKMICDHFTTIYNILQQNNSKYTTPAPPLHSPNLPLVELLKYFFTWRHDFFRIVEYNYRNFLARTWCTESLVVLLWEKCKKSTYWVRSHSWFDRVRVNQDSKEFSGIE